MIESLQLATTESTFSTHSASVRLTLNHESQSAFKYTLLWLIEDQTVC